MLSVPHLVHVKDGGQVVLFLPGFVLFLVLNNRNDFSRFFHLQNYNYIHMHWYISQIDH